MIPRFRQPFNHNFSEAKYSELLQRLDAACGTKVQFRVSETPAFFPRTLLESMERGGVEIIGQLLGNPKYLADSARAIPEKFRVPHESPHPLFLAVDFGITLSAEGTPAPRLIELQGFPTLYAYQPVLTEAYGAVYGLDTGLRSLPPGIGRDAYEELFRSAVLGSQAPENVVLMEIDPDSQKTLPDFHLTEKLCGIATVNIRDVVKQENRLLYRRKDGHIIPINRIYNRTIVDDLVRSGAQIPFDFRDDLRVEWAGHPNWFFRLSKFSLPYLDHPLVPKSILLSKLDALPDNLDRWVLKPLFSFAGSGVIVGPSRAEIEAIPGNQRENFLLQERVDYGSFIETPHGPTKAEVRIMYIWTDRLIAVNNLVRMGRGKMMGVDFNKEMAWVGSSAGLYPEDERS